jgi:hypothetical protein
MNAERGARQVGEGPGRLRGCAGWTGGVAMVVGLKGMFESAAGPPVGRCGQEGAVCGASIPPNNPSGARSGAPALWGCLNPVLFFCEFKHPCSSGRRSSVAETLKVPESADRFHVQNGFSVYEPGVQPRFRNPWGLLPVIMGGQHCHSRGERWVSDQAGRRDRTDAGNVCSCQCAISSIVPQRKALSRRQLGSVIRGIGWWSGMDRGIAAQVAYREGGKPGASGRGGTGSAV